MTQAQRIWVHAKDRLVSATVSLGHPRELAELLAKQLGSPQAMDRMTSYLNQVRPRSAEMVVDEMLAICAEIDAWREKKESQEAQAYYAAWLNSEERWRNAEDE